MSKRSARVGGGSTYRPPGNDAENPESGGIGKSMKGKGETGKGRRVEGGWRVREEGWFGFVWLRVGSGFRSGHRLGGEGARKDKMRK